MTTTKSTDIRLREATAKFNRLKAAVDGTGPAEAAYQKAKKELAFARQAHAETRGTRQGVGDAQVNIQAVAVKAGKARR